jgi:aspartate aminotransferase
LQAPGGCGALRLGAELLRRLSVAAIHVSDPTWANHVPLLGNAGLSIQSYPYFDRATGDVRVEALLEKLTSLPSGSVVLLHGCCHNPSGADLSQSAWLSIAQMLEQRGLIPFVDVAYQGLGAGLDDDAFGVRLLAERLPEVLIAVSCSKNFGLYRERTGAIIVTGRTAAQAENAILQLQQIARGIYSMPPDHGAELVARVWENPALRADWIREVDEMRQRMLSLRQSLVTRLRDLRPDVDYSFVARQRGMFSLLPLSVSQVAVLREQRHIYMPGDGRINVAGLSNRNVDYVAQSLAAVIE